MAAFLAVLVSGGWSYGAPVDGHDPGHGLRARPSPPSSSGQMANAFACRSSTRPAWRLGWRANPLLVWAVGIELLVLVAMLVVPPVADLLGHRPPTLLGLVDRRGAVPAVLAADALRQAGVGRDAAPRAGATVVRR